MTRYIFICYAFVLSAYAFMMPASAQEVTKKDYQSTVVQAKAGDATSQYQLGVMYNNGIGVSKNDVEAVKWFRSAAEQNYAKAQFYLGNMYANGIGVPKDAAESVKWFHKAAEQGDAEAQYNLGIMYDNGISVSENDAESAKWYRKVAEQGHADTQLLLGHIYAEGKGRHKNYIEAFAWYLLSREHGNKKAYSYQTELAKKMTLEQIIQAEELSYVLKGKGRLIQVEDSQCAVWIPYPRLDEKITWDGACLNGRGSGQGTLTWHHFKDGNETQSSLRATLSNGFAEGYGEINSGNGNFYKGNFQYTRYDGLGTLYYAEGDIFEGGFAKGGITGGNGIYTDVEGVKYTGYFYDKNRRSGFITTTYLDGSQKVVNHDQYYRPQKPLIFPNGDEYTGGLNEGHPSGKGHMTYANGDIYFGNWLNGKRAGIGEYSWKNGDVFTGFWQNDNPNSVGTYFYSNGQRFVGEYSNGTLRDGVMYQRPSGTTTISGYDPISIRGSGSITIANQNKNTSTRARIPHAYNEYLKSLSSVGEYIVNNQKYEGMEFVTLSIKREPKEPLGYNLRAKMLQKRKNWEKANRDYRKADSLVPTSRPLFLQERITVQHAIDLENNKRTARNVSKIAEKQRSLTSENRQLYSAFRDVRAALKLAPNDSELKKSLKILEKLQGYDTAFNNFSLPADTCDSLPTYRRSSSNAQIDRFNQRFDDYLSCSNSLARKNYKAIASLVNNKLDGKMQLTSSGRGTRSGGYTGGECNCAERLQSIMDQNRRQIKYRHRKIVSLNHQVQRGNRNKEKRNRNAERSKIFNQFIRGMNDWRWQNQ